MIRDSDCFPGEVKLLPPRKWFKQFGRYSVLAPANASIIRVSTTSTGGQGEFPGGNGCFAASLRKCEPGEAFDLQVGQCGTAGGLGDSWLRRAATGEVLCYADRGRGSGQEGDAAKCLADIARGGVSRTMGGSDYGDVAGFGIGGRWVAHGAGEIRSAQPGSGGWGAASFPNTAKNVGGQGLIIVEFYSGKPALGF